MVGGNVHIMTLIGYWDQEPLHHLEEVLHVITLILHLEVRGRIRIGMGRGNVHLMTLIGY